MEEELKVSLNKSVYGDKILTSNTYAQKFMCVPRKCSREPKKKGSIVRHKKSRKDNVKKDFSG